MELLNQDLFDTPKDAEIARLKLCIERYKEHDKRRTEHYHKVCKELQWYKEEFDTIIDDDKKAALIKSQRANIASLQTKIAMSNCKDFTPEEIDKYKLFKENTTLKMQLAQKRGECKTLKEEISKLVTKLNNK